MSCTAPSAMGVFVQDWGCQVPLQYLNNKHLYRLCKKYNIRFWSNFIENPDNSAVQRQNSLFWGCAIIHVVNVQNGWNMQFMTCSYQDEMRLIKSCGNILW